MKISILIAAKNESTYIGELLSSILNQEHKNIEIIVVDDNSSDNTYSIVSQISLNEPRIKTLKNLSQGKVSAYNLAFQNASGELFCFVGADDILPTNSLSDRANMLIDGKTNFTSCQIKSFGKTGIFGDRTYHKNPKKINYSGGAVLFDKKMANEIFPIPEELPNEDVWSGLILQFFGHGLCTGNIGYHYRIHENNSLGSIGIKNKNRYAKLVKRLVAYKFFYKKFKEKFTDNDLSIIEDQLKIIETVENSGILLATRKVTPKNFQLYKSLLTNRLIDILSF